MAGSFDPTKEAKNLANHRISLSRAFDMEVMSVLVDDRFDYGEIRYRAYGVIDGAAHCLVFTVRQGRVRPISLRRAHAKEMKRYATQKE
ncbi:MAG: BrnT family toxin [Pseudomonadota bacterium]